jgi:hypothetical protein
VLEGEAALKDSSLDLGEGVQAERLRSAVMTLFNRIPAPEVDLAEKRKVMLNRRPHLAPWSVVAT